MTSNTMTVAAIQAMSKGHLLNPENVPHAVRLINAAADQGADLACFPEAYPATGEDEIRRAAHERRIFVIASFLVNKDGSLYNEAVLFDSDGGEVGRQTKVHPVPRLEPFTRGSGFASMETPWGKIGILICIDGWGFPEGFYHLNRLGVDLIFNPCIIFKKKPQKRMSLLTRALDYKIPIVAPNNAVWSMKIFPNDPGLPSEGGNSMIVVPPVFKNTQELDEFMKEAPSCENWIVAEGGPNEEILLANLDLKALRHSRSIWNGCFGECLL